MTSDKHIFCAVIETRTPRAGEVLTPVSAGRLNVAVVGPGSEATNDDLANARRVGQLVAAEGWVLFTGGLGGVMQEASLAAMELGGMTVGILPEEDPGAANPGVIVAIPTGLHELRNGLLVRSASAVIGIGGSWGTLSEIAFAVRTAKTVVQLGGWRVLDENGSEPPGIFKTLLPEEAVAYIKSASS